MALYLPLPRPHEHRAGSLWIKNIVWPRVGESLVIWTTYQSSSLSEAREILAAASSLGQITLRNTNWTWGKHLLTPPIMHSGAISQILLRVLHPAHGYQPHRMLAETYCLSGEEVERRVPEWTDENWRFFQIPHNFRQVFSRWGGVVAGSSGKEISVKGVTLTDVPIGPYLEPDLPANSWIDGKIIWTQLPWKMQTVTVL